MSDADVRGDVPSRRRWPGPQGPSLSLESNQFGPVADQPANDSNIGLASSAPSSTVSLNSYILS